MGEFSPGPIIEVSIEITRLSGLKEKVTCPRIVGLKQSPLATGPQGGQTLVAAIFAAPYDYTLDKLREIIEELEGQRGTV